MFNINDTRCDICGDEAIFYIETEHDFGVAGAGCAEHEAQVLRWFIGSSTYHELEPLPYRSTTTY